MNTIAQSSRRDFIKTAAVVSGGLLVGFSVPAIKDAAAAGTLYTPNAWVHIGDDNTITLISARSEMGQGVYTSMPMLIAEELNVDIRRIKVAMAPPDKALYGNALLGGPQLTGGSTSVRDGWEKLRTAGAQVREMLISAAATKWNVDRSQLRADNGMVLGPNGRQATYGELAQAASKLPVPEKVALKDPSQFRIVGKRTPRLDTPAKTNGTAEYGIDVKLPGMVYAALEQCPVIGGTVRSFDAEKARRMPGVVAVVQIPDGIAVVADSWWRANQARKQLAIVWDEGAGAALNNKSMLEGIRAASVSGTPLPIKKVGDAQAVIAASPRVVRREYVSQLLSHSPLEPMNFTASYAGGKMLLIGPTQWQDGAQGAVAAAVGMQPQDVAVQTTFLGGGFGRRIDLDFIVQAAQISKAINRPVKLVWSREDDMTHDFYRPQALHKMAAALGADGKPTAMTFRMTSQSVTGRVFGLPPQMNDPLMTEAALAPYAIPALQHDYVKHDSGLRVGYWRSVSHLLNAFANESFVDELAKEAGQDPYAYRMSMLGSQPRFANVLKLAADKAGWGTPLPAGRARGIALMEGYDTYMAQVAEVSLVDGAVKVHRVTVAADVGRMVNPDTVEAQIQSSVAFGMGAALMQEITLDKGRVQQTNFHQFPVVRMNEAPAIDIILVDSSEKPGGIGEPATAVVVPAIANAVATLTGKRVRQLPMTAEAIRAA
ncbi:molybdopterin cofactor-binding domain-containing protein [Caenimonas terrae]|uniref:Molybdopterin cofactor-binding domain-containing protein n=1 Tax=Caenimonas terrae TaxID=696074 RepID=A0ABW0NDM2_9BURK